MSKKIQETIPPEGGWKPSTWYLVDVKYTAGNPVHRSLFYSGFLNGNRDGTIPGGYNCLVPLSGPSEDGVTSFGGVRYLKAVRVVLTEAEVNERSKS